MVYVKDGDDDENPVHRRDAPGVRPGAALQQPSADQREDALRRLNMWLERLEEQASRLLEAVEPEELGPVHAANIAAKYIALLARLLLMRQQFAPETSSLEDQLLSFILDDEDK